ncbi:laminin EGF-like protein [Trichuris suis]|nr:laminin EGF-like protein [Trichuris suis]
MRFYGLPAAPVVPKFSRDDEVICTSQYSKLDPLEDGEIHTSLVNGRPGIDGPSDSLQKFTRARFVRLRLQKLRTLNSDLIYVTRNPKHDHIDETVTRRYFYAIRDISIGGQCICYGHAESCPADPVTGQLQCECAHNTCGENCEICCPMFNQKKWQPGTSANSGNCEPCQCYNHSTECRYDDEVEKRRLSVTPLGVFEGGGVCVDCMGVNCEECRDFFYRPSDISHHREDACRPCDCDPVGSVDGTCVKDDTKADGVLKPGDCYCKFGFGGQRCDRCAVGFRNFPSCEPCPCSRAGSFNYATCEDECVCKANVEGIFCDRCKPGYINLDEDNVNGCTPCFCFGLTDKCREGNLAKRTIVSMAGWKLTDTDGLKLYEPSGGGYGGTSLTMDRSLVEDLSLEYWKAPSEYTGDMIGSYGGYLRYYVYYVAEQSKAPIPTADVILMGNGVAIEHRVKRPFSEKENVTVSVKLHELSEWYDSRTKLPVGKIELMTALANLNTLLIRAVYDKHQLQSNIYSVSLEVASPTLLENSTLMNSVEICDCPDKFTGLSCQACASGYRRVQNIIYKGQCEICQCNGRSSSCDPMTGHCLDCQYQTTGPRCEHCAPGYYGNPLLPGPEGACQPCACPLFDPSNNFSPSCISAEYGISNAKGIDYICTSCAIGYTGMKCEQCADGYFGNPMIPGNYCQPCQCNGNIDTAAVGNCHHTSGECLKCVGNTEGWSCEKCKAGHYGSALANDCRYCDCNLHGSLSANCDMQTGQCTCKEHYTGLQCDRCKDGHGDIENGCPSCECSQVGSLSLACDPVSGQCPCKPGVFGKRCDTCVSGYYEFSENGCRYCNCDADGSVEQGICDIVTGQCSCRPHVTGQRCDRCETGFFNITSRSGCQPCICDPNGSLDSICDPVYGQCRCKEGVVGEKCDKCAPNFFGIVSNGCEKCPQCPAPGHVCHPTTGECVCPPNTVGSVCESCAPNSWNYDPLKGCEPCSCNMEGSANESCDVVTGACQCRPSYRGQKCDQCMSGFFDFPVCLPCDCFKAGTDPATCNSETGCTCDETGQCACKKNVRGKKCSECQPFSFSLEDDNPDGCTECFCFDRTNFCIQSSYVWQQISGEDRTVFFAQPWLYWSRVHGYEVLPHEPLTLNSYPTDVNPIYWPLPKRFLGDRVTSYNGFIRFQVSNSGNDYLGSLRPDEQLFERFPLVVLVGNHRLIFEHYKLKSHISASGVYAVKLREDEWKAKGQTELSVSRQSFMIALQNLQAIYVRATFTERLQEASLSGVMMDIGVLDNSTLSLNRTAIGVEDCDCPKEYSGSSCQNPSDGYCRKKAVNYLDMPNELDLVGIAVPCECHEHSSQCDRETCKCLVSSKRGNANCSFLLANFAIITLQETFAISVPLVTMAMLNRVPHMTVVNVRVRRLVTASARPAMPFLMEKDTFVISANMVTLVVTAKVALADTLEIPPQLEAPASLAIAIGTARCVNCAILQLVNAFVGKVSLDVIVQNVNQDLRSLERVANVGTLLAFFLSCSSKSLIAACDVGCTKELMSDLDFINDTIGKVNISHFVPAPWGRARRLENATADLRHLMESIKQAAVDADRIVADRFQDGDHFGRRVSSASKDADYLLDKIRLNKQRANELNNNATNMQEKIRRVLDKSHRMREMLNTYIHGVSRASPDRQAQWRDEMNELLDSIRQREDYLQKHVSRAEMELKKEKELLAIVLSKKFNDTQFERLKEKASLLAGRWGNMRHIVWDIVRKQSIDSDFVLKTVEKMFRQFEDLGGEVDRIGKDSLSVLDNAQTELDNATQDLLDVHDHYTDANHSLGQLQSAISECDKKSGQYAGLLPSYREKYYYPAESHAAGLEVRSAEIKNSFTESRDASHMALLASGAYLSIVEALGNASEAAGKAEKATSRTGKVTNPLLKLAREVANKSVDLYKGASELKVDELRQKIDKFERLTGELKSQIDHSVKDVEGMWHRFDKFDDFHNKMEGVHEHAKKANKQAANAESSAISFASGIGNLLERTKEFRSLTRVGIRNVTDNVNHSLNEVLRARERLNRVRTQADNNDQKVFDLNDKLSLLREKIKEAREKAAKIKLSVKSSDSDGCFRSYVSPLTPSIGNHLSISYRPADGVPDSLLFITQTEKTRTQSSEYIAVELRDRQIVFLWNIGGGDQKVTNKKQILPVARRDRDSWYSIDVERYGNAVTLNVSDEQGTQSVHYDGGGSSSVFGAQPGRTTMSIGVEPSKVPVGIGSTKFRGTIGHINIDGHGIPLWSFLADDQCVGSFPKATGASPEGLVPGSFFRDGYAQVSPNGLLYDVREFRIQVNFATYSESGLLYFRGDPKTKDFVSIELKEGRLMMQFYLGGLSRLRLLSNRAYNDGKFHNVLALRMKTNGTLRVDNGNDIVNGEAPPGSTGLNIRDHDHFIGGVPDSFPKNAWFSYNVHWKGFYGCIRSISHGFGQSIDLKNAIKSLNVEDGCYESNSVLATADRVVSFNGQGVFAMSGITLRSDSTFSLNLRTSSADGLVLYQSSAINARRKRRSNNGKGFLAIYMSNGHIVMRIGVDVKSSVTLETDQVFNDGRLHTIVVRRSRDSVALFVDDEAMDSAAFAFTKKIGSPRAVLFLGGLGALLAPNDELPVTRPIVGCLSDLFLNVRRLLLIPQYLNNTQLGYCILSPSDGYYSNFFSGDGFTVYTFEKRQSVRKTISLYIEGFRIMDPALGEDNGSSRIPFLFKKWKRYDFSSPRRKKSAASPMTVASEVPLLIAAGMPSSLR